MNSPETPLAEQIEDPLFRHAVHLLDAGDAVSLRSHLQQHPQLAKQRVLFEDRSYFRSPTLLEFTAENPIRHGTLPPNIVEIASTILDAGADQSSLNETLALVCSGCVTRECHLQLPLIHLLCDRGANPNFAMHPALVHGEFEAINALIQRGSTIDLPTAAALGDAENVYRLLPHSGPEDRHRALALASQFGHLETVRTLLDAGEDPSRYNPAGFHGHSTPLHQAAFAGHDQLVRLLVERHARLDLKDHLWQGTPADWAEHAGHTDLAAHLRT